MLANNRLLLFRSKQIIEDVCDLRRDGDKLISGESSIEVRQPILEAVEGTGQELVWSMAFLQICDKGIREDLFLLSAPGLSEVSAHKITGGLPVIERGSLAILKDGGSLQHLPEPMPDLMASGADVR